MVLLPIAQQWVARVFFSFLLCAVLWKVHSLAGIFLGPPRSCINSSPSYLRACHTFFVLPFSDPYSRDGPFCRRWEHPWFVNVLVMTLFRLHVPFIAYSTYCIYVSVIKGTMLDFRSTLYLIFPRISQSARVRNLPKNIYLQDYQSG